MPYISELITYPLKSAKGISSKKLKLNTRGPEFDRDWMVINSNKRFLSQRQHPSMCLIETKLSNNCLTLTAPKKTPITIDFDSNSNTQNVVVWGDQVPASDCGDEAAAWISNYLSTECRLVHMPKETLRLVDTVYAKQNETVSFADGFPSLIISQASLDDFNSKLERPITMAHFRPNIIIESCPPFAEDEWQVIKVNGITFSLVKPCSRCIIPAIEPESGSKRMDIIKALSKHRRRGNATYFGQNALHDTQGIIQVGDEVEILI